MYRSDNTDILFKAQRYIEDSIKALNNNIKLSGTTFNINNGNISNDVIIHGNNTAPITTGSNNYQR